jgi:hypothetical protein
VSDYGLDDRAIGVRSPAGIEDFTSNLCVQTGSGAHPASCTMCTGGPFPGGKTRPGRDADHSPPSSAEVENEYELYLLSPQAFPLRVVGLLYFYQEIIKNVIHCGNTFRNYGVSWHVRPILKYLCRLWLRKAAVVPGCCTVVHIERFVTSSWPGLARDRRAHNASRGLSARVALTARGIQLLTYWNLLRLRTSFARVWC